MEKEVVHLEAKHLRLDDLVEYGEVVAKVVNVFKGVQHIQPDGEVKLPTIKSNIGHEKYEWDMGTLKRSE